MASRAITSSRDSAIDWRVVLRRSLRRASEITGAAVLFLALIFLAVALITYNQTDPSGSTAAGGSALNWMGDPGAWVADKAYFLFGVTAFLLLPLLYVSARRLWDLAEDADDESRVHWLRPLGVLLLGMTLGGTALSLAFSSAMGSLPAGAGGLLGLLGATAVRAVAGLVPAAEGWIILGVGVVMLAASLLAIGKVFMIDWLALLKRPLRFKAKTAALTDRDDGEDQYEDLPFTPSAQAKDRGEAKAAQLVENPRKPPEISDPGKAVASPQATVTTKQGDLFDKYKLPSIELLTEANASAVPKIDKLALERNARLLETVLDDFNVKGEITAVRTGPVVTMYELEPAPGIKASRVIGLADDIARNMSAVSARVSSIPGRTVMGIELPNADRQMVSFREMIGSEVFVNSKGLLPIILGKDIAGEPIVADLATMPHLLVAGTTGSGKSVGLNTILLSLLYRLTPAQCRLILVDPKVLELKSYDDIPHLLSPVVTEPAKAVRALKWAVEEMERRYRQMSSIGVRNLSGFNDKVRAAQAKGKPLGRRVQIGFDPETGEELFEEQQLDYQVLPQIVVIVDELADLMVTVGKEIEVLIQRLSQKSRAAGIHLIMATQRPSVDVITGVIKANLPTRISFAVTSRIDSRTILGEQGAEQLLGKGDMLYKPNTDPIKRVHGPFVSDEEVERVADHWRSQGAPEYVDSVTEEPEDGGFSFDDLDATASDNPEERKYRQVCQLVFESQKASASWIQRQMGVGYNTASKWIERMEADGLVGPANHVGRRDIYRDKDGNPL